MSQPRSESSGGFRHFLRKGREIVLVPRDRPVRELDITRLNKRDLHEVLEYRMVEMMAMAGFSYKAIGTYLGLNMGEVAFRVKRSGVHVRDYRDGKSRLAQEVIGRLDEVAKRKLVDNLEQYLLR